MSKIIAIKKVNEESIPMLKITAEVTVLWKGIERIIPKDFFFTPGDDCFQISVFRDGFCHGYDDSGSSTVVGLDNIIRMVDHAEEGDILSTRSTTFTKDGLLMTLFRNFIFDAAIDGDFVGIDNFAYFGIINNFIKETITYVRCNM